jgi:hypothetical protein
VSLAVPTIGGETRGDVQTEADRILREVQQDIRAHGLAEIVKAWRGQDSDGSLLKGLGDAIGSLGNGMKSIMELQSTASAALLKTLQSQVQGEGSGMGGLFGTLMLLMFLQMMQKQQTTSETGPGWKEYTDLLRTKLEQLEQRGPSPTEMRMQTLADQLVAEAITSRHRNPLESLTDQLDTVVKVAERVGNLGGGPGRGRISREELEWLGIQKEREAARFGHLERVEQIRQGDRVWGQHVPKLAGTIVGGIAGALARYGFAPVADAPELDPASAAGEGAPPEA